MCTLEWPLVVCDLVAAQRTKEDPNMPRRAWILSGIKRLSTRTSTWNRWTIHCIAVTIGKTQCTVKLPIIFFFFLKVLLWNVFIVHYKCISYIILQPLFIVMLNIFIRRHLFSIHGIGLQCQCFVMISKFSATGQRSLLFPVKWRVLCIINFKRKNASEGATV